MPTRKRPMDGTLIEDASVSKRAKTSSDSRRLQFEVRIRIPGPSAAKASRNDWKPLTPSDRQMQASVLSNSISSSTNPRILREAVDEGGNENSCYDEYGENDKYEVYDWVEPIQGFVLSKKANASHISSCVGSSSSVLIRRDIIRRCFYDRIEEPTEKIALMKFGLFDRYGRLKPAFKQGSSRSGSGIWGDEMDYGDILLIDQVRVDKRHRRKGLGREMIRAILRKALTKCNPQSFTAIARPAIMMDFEREINGKSLEERNVIYDRETLKAESFLRSLGFRRIGYTEWFAFLPGNIRHACHSLPAEKDFDPPRPTPIHRTNKVFELLLEAFKTKTEDLSRLGLMQRALDSCGPEEDVWVSVDQDGNTLLHHLATSDSRASVKWLVEKCPRLLTARNYLGETPLDSCQEHLENIRTQFGVLGKILPSSDLFTGYEQPHVDILCSLKRLSNPSPGDLRQLKYGCTCGQCREGFLSPRMYLALSIRAEVLSEMMTEVVAADMDGKYFSKRYKKEIEYLDPGMRAKIRTSKTLRFSFASIFSAFSQLLMDDKKEVPHMLKILEMVVPEEDWPRGLPHHLYVGGLVKAVGSAIFSAAMEDSEWAGDGSIEADYEADLHLLPACRNDDEFGFASGLCRFENVRPPDWVDEDL